MFAFALTSHGIDDAIFHVANALEVPVLILALLALAVVFIEVGRFIAELWSRSGRGGDLEAVASRTRSALLASDRDGAMSAAYGASRSASMTEALSVIVPNARVLGGDHRVSKALADFDYEAQQRLAHTRLLVRAGPALGLMGTLIPLSPALTGLANGNVARLTSNLRVAFSVTVVGLLIGAIAFGLSLYRDRMYGQDLSDLEYLAAVVSDPRPLPTAVVGDEEGAQRD